MSHVDEGALHAYLDGALDALPASEAARIREHLTSCEACARRLEEERALREEAASILAGADPGVGLAPPLEELRRRAAAPTRVGAPTRSGAGSRLRQLTWAASLVLAVGAGWLLRGSRDPRISEALDPFLREPAVERAVPEAAREDPAPPAPAVDEVVAAGSAVAETAPAPTGAVEAQVMEERVADVVAEAEPSRAEAAPSRADVAGLAGAEAMAPKAAPVAAPSMAVTGEARGGEITRPLARPRAAVLAADETARRIQGRPGTIAVPGLPVLSMETDRIDLPAGTLRVLQLLDGDTLELLHLPAGVEPTAVTGGAAAGRTEVAARYGAGWLVARAHASVALLDSLLARVTGGS